MPKRPKNWTPTPAERRKQSEAAKFKILKGGYEEGNSYEEAIKLKALEWWKKYNGGYVTTHGTAPLIIEPIEPEKPKDPVKEFTNDWYEKNKHSL